jgi:transcriptional regulator with XRE-family HTH domain
MNARGNFGDELRAWRKKREWLQKQAADALEVPLETYRAWEYNKSAPNKSPSMAEILTRMESSK